MSVISLIPIHNREQVIGKTIQSVQDQSLIDFEIIVVDIDHSYIALHKSEAKMYLNYGELSDGLNLRRVVEQVQPDEVYNLAARSHVAVSFTTW